MAKHPFFCPETSGKIALLQIKASQSILFEAAKESIRVSSALAWTEVLGLEWLGWCKLVGHEHDREPLLPLTVSAGNGSYWCIKSQPADPDLIILGHLKISSGRPLVATLGRCLLCTQLRSPKHSSWRTLLTSGSLSSSSCRSFENTFLISCSCGDPESGRQVAPLWFFFAGCQMWKTLMRARCLPSKTKLGCLVVTSPPH